MDQVSRPEDPFAIFDLKLSFAIDQEDLLKRYYERARAWHPDLCTDKGEATRKSSVLNWAFALLRDDEKRIDWILASKGVVVTNTPPALALEWMDAERGDRAFYNKVLAHDKALVDAVKVAMQANDERSLASLRQEQKYIRSLLQEVQAWIA